VKRFRAWQWVLMTCILGSLVTEPTGAAVSEAQSGKINGILQATLGDYHLASITAEVRQNGQIIYAKSLGDADLQNDVPATPQGLYAIGSITKSLTSFAILSLVNQGKLQLSSKLGEVLPGYKGPARVVTILQLLTHTAGVPDYAGDSALPLFGDPGKQYTEQEVVDLFKDKPLVFEPGTRWQYSNSGYYLLSLVIEKVSGKSYGDAVQDLLLTPFGLSHIVLGSRAPIIKKRVVGYTINPGGRIENALTCDFVMPLGAGAYFASADDLTRYVADLFSAQVPATMHQMMFHNVTLADGTLVNYLPAALQESDFYGHKRFGHAGGYWGFLAYVAYYPDDKVAVAVLTNTDSTVSKAGNLPTSSVVSRISRVILGVPDPEIANLPVSAAVAKAYVGTYRTREFMGSSDEVKFLYSQHALFMKVGSGTRATWYARQPSVSKATADQEMQGAVQLLYQGEGRFVQQDNHEAEVVFVKGHANHPDVRIGDWYLGSFVGSGSPPP
jgi:D-alanyl-D-alanine carboxypeptidase